MTNYRKAFFLALVGNVVFIGVLAGIWWTVRRSTTTQPPAGSAPNVATQAVQSSSAGSASPATETPLAPVQLSAERLQSIGVKFGVVKRKYGQLELSPSTKHGFLTFKRESPATSRRSSRMRPISTCVKASHFSPFI